MEISFTKDFGKVTLPLSPHLFDCTSKLSARAAEAAVVLSSGSDTIELPVEGTKLRGIALHPSGSFIAAYGPRYLVIWAINEVEGTLQCSPCTGPGIAGTLQGLAWRSSGKESSSAAVNASFAVVEVPPPPSAVKSEQGSNGKPMLRVFNLITHGGSSHYVTAAERELDTSLGAAHVAAWSSCGRTLAVGCQHELLTFHSHEDLKKGLEKGARLFLWDQGADREGSSVEGQVVGEAAGLSSIPCSSQLSHSCCFAVAIAQPVALPAQSTPTWNMVATGLKEVKAEKKEKGGTSSREGRKDVAEASRAGKGTDGQQLSGKSLSGEMEGVLDLRGKIKQRVQSTTSAVLSSPLAALKNLSTASALSSSMSLQLGGSGGSKGAALQPPSTLVIARIPHTNHSYSRALSHIPLPRSLTVPNVVCSVGSSLIVCGSTASQHLAAVHLPTTGPPSVVSCDLPEGARPRGMKIQGDQLLLWCVKRLNTTVFSGGAAAGSGLLVGVAMPSTANDAVPEGAGRRAQTKPERDRDNAAAYSNGMHELLQQLQRPDSSQHQRRSPRGSDGPSDSSELLHYLERLRDSTPRAELSSPRRNEPVESQTKGPTLLSLAPGLDMYSSSGPHNTRSVSAGKGIAPSTASAYNPATSTRARGVREKRKPQSSATIKELSSFPTSTERGNYRLPSSLKVALAALAQSSAASATAQAALAVVLEDREGSTVPDSVLEALKATSEAQRVSSAVVSQVLEQYD